jgi:hypothetical protein
MRGNHRVFPQPSLFGFDAVSVPAAIFFPDIAAPKRRHHPDLHRSLLVVTATGSHQ